MSSASGQLSALVTLIAKATKTVEEHFEKSTKPGVPSLDDVEPHPLDTQIATSELRNAIQIIEGACAQLCATVARPNHTIVNKFMNVFEPACINAAITFKIPDILMDKPEGMHISEIEQKTGLEARKAGRILRLLATKHCFREVSNDVFANNRISVQLLSTNPINSLAFHFTDEISKATICLSETLQDPEWGHSYAANQTAFNKATGTNVPVFENVDEAKASRFAIAMMGWNATTESNSMIQEYPWYKLSHGASVCDVGGGIGNITLQLAKAYPNLKLKLQDMPERILQARDEVWPKECPEAIAEGRIEFKSIDFFKEVPIKNCDVYYLKNIIHDWPDKDCVTILSNVKKSMAPHSRVLIHEYALQSANRTPTTTVSKYANTQAPYPLLPNYGVGRIRQYNLDLDMMVALNSEERTVEHFIRLGEESGLVFEKLWDFGETCIIEFAPAPQSQLPQRKLLGVKPDASSNH